MALQPGTRLGPYQIQSALGAGGIGESLPGDRDHIRHSRARLRDYPPEVLENWGANSPAAVTRQQQAIRESRELTWVAVTGNTIVGFSALDPQQCVVRAVYVAAETARSGIGTRLLAAVEEKARALRIARLTLDSSLNAESFYRHHGYISLGECMHVLATGVRMTAVRMEKILAGSSGTTRLAGGLLP